MFGKWKKNFCLRILCVCVCVCVSEFWSKNFVFGKELLSYNRNFVFEKRIFGVIVCNQNFVFGKRIFVPEFCVCVCLRIFVSEFLVFWKKNFFCNRNFEKESFFTHVKSECFQSMYQNLRVFIKINIMKKLTSLQFSLYIFVGFFSHNGVHV